MPFISIIVPVYNVEKYLEKCLNSILTQSNQDFELIIVNDGSTDNSRLICESYKEHYPEKIKLIHQKNYGLLMARRVGFQAASGEYVLCVDSDDYQMPGIIQAIYDVTKRYNCDMVLFDYVYGSGQNKPEREIHVCPEKSITYFPSDEISRFQLQLIVGKDINSLCCKAVRRSCVDSCVDYSEWKFVANGEDSFQSLPILDAVKSICYIPKTGYFYRRDNISMSKHYGIKDFDSFMCVYKRTLEYINRWGFSHDILKQVNCRYADLLSVVIHQAKKGINKEDYHAFLKAVSKNDLFNELCNSVHVDNWYQKIFFTLLLHEKITLLIVFMKIGGAFSSIKKHRKVIKS